MEKLRTTIPPELLVKISQLQGDEDQSIEMINELMSIETPVNKLASSMIFNHLIKETDSPDGIWGKIIDCEGFPELFDLYDDGSYWIRTQEIGVIAGIIDEVPKLTINSNKYVANIHLLKNNKVLSLEHIKIKDYMKLEYLAQLDTLVKFALLNPEQVKPEDYSIWLHTCELIKYDQQSFLDKISQDDIFNYTDIEWWLESELCSSVSHITWFLRKFDKNAKALKFTTQNYRFNNLFYKLNDYVDFPEDIRAVLFQIVFEHGNGGDLIISLSMNSTQHILAHHCIEYIYLNYPDCWNKMKKLNSIALTCSGSDNEELREWSLYTMMEHLVFLKKDDLKAQLQTISEYNLDLLVHYKQFVTIYYSMGAVVLNLFGENTGRIINDLGITSDVLPYVENTQLWKELL